MSTTNAATSDQAAPFALDAVVESLGALQRAWGGALPAFAGASGQSAAPDLPAPDLAAHDLATMDDAGILRIGDQLGALQHTLDAVAAAWAGTVASRSGAELGGDGLTKSHGFSSPVALIAEKWRVTTARAAAFVDVGTAVVPKRSFLGQAQPCEFPAVAAAIRTVPQAALTIDAAAPIVRELRLGAAVAAAEKVAAVEQLLVEHCAGAPVTTVRRAAVTARTILDEDGIEPREHLLRTRRTLTLAEQPDGTTRLTATLDPESAMWVRGAIDAIVGQSIRAPRFPTAAEQIASSDAGPDIGPTNSQTTDQPAPDTHTTRVVPADSMPDPRSIGQLRVDALVEACRHVSGCAGAANELAPVSIVVRIGLKELQDGLGAAHIDTVTEPINAGTVRRMASDAELIPEVLGGNSNVLDLGVGRRLFSKAQRMALAERDGGCAWTGCPHPPGYTEAHHIRWWSNGGATDLGNGVLLCSHHHHRVHADGWRIEVRKGSPWFIPPAHIDPSRTPRRGGRLRLRSPE